MKNKKREAWINERNIMFKEWLSDCMTCTDCGKQFEAAKMTIFRTETTGPVTDHLVAATSYWEEVIPGKNGKIQFPGPDAVPVKVFCPYCVDRVRRQLKKWKRFKLLLFLIFLGFLIILLVFF